MDGVLYRGEVPIPGSAAAIGKLRAGGVRVLFCTNNSRWTTARHVGRLAGLGIPSEAHDILSSAVVTGRVLSAKGLAGRRALVVGGEGLREEVAAAGLEPVTEPPIDAVVVGWDPHFDYSAMSAASRAVRDGALFVASNDDAAWPAPTGLMPGAGAILASIEVASGRRAEVLGKPHAPMLDAIAARLGKSSSIVMIGDRPETDLAGAHERGWMTALVLSGVTGPEDVEKVSPAPDVVAASLAELVDGLQMRS